MTFFAPNLGCTLLRTIAGGDSERQTDSNVSREKHGLHIPKCIVRPRREMGSTKATPVLGISNPLHLHGRWPHSDRVRQAQASVRHPGRGERGRRGDVGRGGSTARRPAQRQSGLSFGYRIRAGATVHGLLWRRRRGRDLHSRNIFHDLEEGR